MPTRKEFIRLPTPGAKDSPLLRVFQRQLILQCEFVILAAKDADAGLPQNQNSPELTYYGLQNLLNAAANISKALWGARGTPLAKRKALRDSIGITDDSPLRPLTMRNKYEHFDEKLDEWWKKTKSYRYLDTGILFKAELERLKWDEIDRFRNWDTETCDLSFWGEEFNTKRILDEVRRILPKLKEEFAKPYSVPPPR